MKTCSFLIQLANTEGCICVLRMICNESSVCACSCNHHSGKTLKCKIKHCVLYLLIHYLNTFKKRKSTSTLPCCVVFSLLNDDDVLLDIALFYLTDNPFLPYKSHFVDTASFFLYQYISFKFC